MKAMTMRELQALINDHLARHPEHGPLEASFVTGDFAETMVITEIEHHWVLPAQYSDPGLSVVEIRLEVASA